MSIRDPSKNGSQPIWGRDPRLKTTDIAEVVMAGL